MTPEIGPDMTIWTVWFWFSLPCSPCDDPPLSPGKPYDWIVQNGFTPWHQSDDLAATGQDWHVE